MSAKSSDAQPIRVPGFPPTVGPYADVVRAGNFIWVSGIVAIDEDGRVLYGDDPRRQIEFVLNRLRDALSAAGTVPGKLVQLTNYVTDAALRPLIHRAREGIIPEAAPASTMVVVAGLIEPGLVYEVEAVALDVV